MKTTSRVTMSTRLLAGILLAIFTGLFIIASPKTPTFTDVPTTNWAYQYVEEAYSKGYVSGVGGGRYDPDGQVTYSEFAAMLVRCFYSNTLSTYYGPTDTWYAPYMTVAGWEGILVGTQYVEGRATVDTPLNRYEMAMMIYNVLFFSSYDMPSRAEVSAAASRISDYNQMPAQYREVVSIAVAAGVLSGVDTAGTFSGSSSMTRAQAAVVLLRLSSVGAGERDPSVSGGAESAAPEISTSSAGDTTFAFLNGEDVQTMMDRINAATPSYRAGYLTNGKPITTENIQEMLAGIERTMPAGTQWSKGEQFKYITPMFIGFYRVGACNAFGAAISDAIFGEDAPITRHQNFSQIKVGDVIYFKNGKDVSHVSVCITEPDSSSYFEICDGNVSGKVSWHGYEYIPGAFGDEDFVKNSWVYSRY